MKTIKNLTADQIRKSILQLAMQGKLVKQDLNDEPACELVKRIYAEKQKLIKEGKIKKDKIESYIFKGDDNFYYEKIGNNEPMKLEDLPFDIPDNWAWIRLKSISNISSGGTPDRENPKYWNGDIPWLKISDITSSNKYVEKASEYITISGLENSSAKILQPGAILYTIFATIGEVGILKFKASCNQAIAAIDTYLKEIDEYLYLFLTNLQDYMKSIGKGCAQFNINQKVLKEALIALPPLAEQQRIVDRIAFVEPLLAKYDSVEKKFSTLEAGFSERLKKSILQYAIEGKLVKQDPNDEPVSTLLERIKAEKERLIKEGKIKRDKNESCIYQGDDKNYYENLPQGWVICSLGNLATYKKGPFGSSLTKGMFVPNTYPNRIKVYEQKNAIQHDSNLGNYYISYEKYQEMIGFKVNPLDFIVSCAGTIGEIYKLPYNAQNGIINQALMKVTLINEEISDYFELIFYDALHKLSEKSKGTAIKNIAPFEILKPALIQLPPLEEQKRILKKLGIISTLVDC